MKIKSNTTNNDLPCRFGLNQRLSSEENGTNSSSGSCHGSNVTFYEPGWGQLHTEPHVQQISCHVTSLPWQEPEEELVPFFSSEVLW